MASSESSPTNNDVSDISMNSFLNFLKITCQLNDPIYNKDSKSSAEIDYNKLANNEIVNSLMGSKIRPELKHDSNELGDEQCKSFDSKGEKFKINTLSRLNTSFKKSQGDNIAEKGPRIHPVLASKLEEVINEGILDSVLPFICPPTSNLFPSTSNGKGNKGSSKVIEQSSKINSQQEVQEKDKKDEPQTKENNSQPTFRSPRLPAGGGTKTTRTFSSRRKSACQPKPIIDDSRSDAEVVIHVCDEVKNTSKDFSCPQYLLVSKMGYFADVTAGQKLEDMDISVHCDIQIFDWLMKWVKKDQQSSDSSPSLDATNVVPILVSASFLQMEPLLLDCLSFCHARLNEVVRASTNLSCLNDSIITRLAAMFTNMELEMVKDKKERVTPRLWTKMIQSLFETEPQALRGHYFSLAGLFRCARCGKFITQSVSSYVTCIPSNTRLNRWGQLISQHVRDTSWQVTTYVATLFKELKSWRKVYWKLWGHCHYLYCCICESHFPTYQMMWCQYHPEQPQFLGPVTEGRIAGPAGRYPCCGQQAFRYETLPGPNGCQYREHSVIIESDRDRAILTLAQIAAEGNCLYEISPVKAQNNGIAEPRWIGISLMPIKCRQGLLPVLHVEDFHGKYPRRFRQASKADSSSETESSEGNERRYLQKQFSTSSDGCESDPSSPRQYAARSRRRHPKVISGRYWSGEMSARSNQDNQREFEEKIMKQIVAMVSKKTGSETNIQYSTYQCGGVYVKLEAEWREQVRQKNLHKQKLK